MPIDRVSLRTTDVEQRAQRGAHEFNTQTRQHKLYEELLRAFDEGRALLEALFVLRKHADAIRYGVVTKLSAFTRCDDLARKRSPVGTVQKPLDLLSDLESALAKITAAISSSIRQTWYVLASLSEFKTLFENEEALSCIDGVWPEHGPASLIPIEKWLVQIRSISDELFIESVRADNTVATIKNCESVRDRLQKLI